MKRIVSLFCAFAMLLCLASCTKTENVPAEKQEESDVVNNEVAEDITQTTLVAPKTVMDLFDGERRLWFYIDSEDADDGLRYDCPVQQVFVIENKKVIGMYYSFAPSLFSAGKNAIPNPISGEKFVLSDFEGMSDDEIINALKAVYANANTTYNLDFSHTYDEKGVVVGSDNVFSAAPLPFNIQYKGYLDDSGNKLENEEIKIFGLEYKIDVHPGDPYYQVNINRTAAEIDFHSLIRPTKIKDKEYLGIESGLGNMLITINNYPYFNSLEFDDPSGATDW
ncbi:MAG: hypothetical protein IJZ88_07305 [Clostridia bacterium]|nr:hypothetical protein [Clostridia bacterium]